MWEKLSDPQPLPERLSAESIADAVARRLEPKFASLEARQTRLESTLLNRAGAAVTSPIGESEASATAAGIGETHADDDPWATVLRGDAQVRAMLKELRSASLKNAKKLEGEGDHSFIANSPSAAAPAVTRHVCPFFHP